MPRTIIAVATLLAVAAFADLALAQTTPVVPDAAKPWMNKDLGPDQRADLLQAKMTRDEELLLVRGYFGVDAAINPVFPPPPDEIRNALPRSAGYIPGIPRLGVPAQIETDASLGVANGRHMRPGDQATALPASILTASTWNLDLAYQAGVTLGSETRNKGFNVLLNGGVDLVRDPRNGRNFEYVGEDPLLAGMIAGETIRGAQDQHIISTAKHFAVNAQEVGRFWLSANLSESAMRESDLLAFEIAIERGDPGSIMCAYNRVNGVYSCENDFLLNRVLKGDWKYPGYVMSDWGGAHSTVDAANNGLDQESAYIFDREDFFGDALKQALATGKIPDSRLLDMVHRVLRSMFAKGLFDYPLVPKPIDVEGSAAVVQKAAEEGIVLLKNDKGLLPLGRTARRIAVIGGRADVGVMSGGGSSQVIPVGNDPSHEFLMGGGIIMQPGQNARIPLDRIVYDPPSPLTALRAELPQAKVRFDDGSNLESAIRLARDSDVVIVFAEQWQAEGNDVPNLSLPGKQDALIQAIAGANSHTVVVLETGGPVLMPWLERAGAVLEAWYPGQRGANALARILTGKVNPSGRLPVTFPQSESQLPRPAIPGHDITEPQDAWASNPTFFDVGYIEGADAGYKWFAARKLTPLFPFGYGLSYTTFTYGGLGAIAGTAPTVSFEVRNTGKRAGKATAQVYATPPAAIGHATTRLVAFKKVELKPGETRRVTVPIDRRLLASFDVAANVWRIAEGGYAIGLGSSSAAISASETIHLEAGTLKP